MTFELPQTAISDRFTPSFLTKLAMLRFGAPVVHWWQRRATEHALQWLSDRDLTDIGVARHEIRELARSQAPIDAMSAKRRAT
ncbi:hypothetical protein CO652_29125 [Rhizobium sp. H4]|uniref:DUF1127 domain-containing protein n=1 Tax=Rhizobium sp. H4 TaxID=2035449 RepID=UPI000BE86E47|nr:DUF1127 domain-containing protein [Rhizobium sp. H4]PDV84961.1 hypothetical protein CO652_29125 [Rhizobium sp. H4]